MVICTRLFPADHLSIKVINWSYSPTKSSSLSSVIAEDNWKSIKDIKKISLPPRKTEYQYIWLKGKFETKGRPKEYYGISLGRINHLYETYLNDKLVASLGTKDINQMFSTRHYRIRSGDLKDGINSIYIGIEIQNNTTEGIGNRISVVIMPRDEFNRDRFLHFLFYILFPFSMAFFFLLSITIFFIILLFNKDRRIFYLVIALNLISVLYIAFLFLPCGIISPSLQTSLLLINYPLSVLVFIYTYQALYRVFLSGQNYIIIIVIILVSALLLFFNTAILAYPLNKILFISLVVIFSLYQMYILLTLNSIKKDSIKLYGLLGLLTFNIIFYLSTALTGEMGSRYIYFTFVYSFVPGPILIPFFIVRDYQFHWLKMEFIYRNLKNRKKGTPDILISGSSEKKLEIILQFIRDNYNQDISREGLARAVGVSPNYMSSLFNQYMNMRIDEYINKLRVESASLLLQENNSSIIDVAFKVGFESLPTFNRAFKKVFGVTPSKYRSNNTE